MLAPRLSVKRRSAAICPECKRLIQVAGLAGRPDSQKDTDAALPAAGRTAGRERGEKTNGVSCSNRSRDQYAPCWCSRLARR